MSGPVTALIEQRLLATIREKSLLVWLDADGAWTPYVDALLPRAKDLGFTVLAFRGSYLELMLAMRNEATGADKPPLVLHLPGLSDESVRKTPALELYLSGFRFEHNLASVVKDAGSGRVPQADLEQFVSRPELTLASADAFLGEADRPRDDSQRSLIATMEAAPFLAYLPSAQKDGLLTEALEARAKTLFGFSKGLSNAETLDDAVREWLLCVEFVDDLRRSPREARLQSLKALDAKTIARCREQATRWRRESPADYRQRADRYEAHLGVELQSAPEDLGRVDTFRFEAKVIYRGAVEALRRGDWKRVLDWHRAHEEGAGFWATEEQPRRLAWQLVEHAALLGQALSDAPRPLEKVETHEEALEHYTRLAAPVDTRQRQFEQRHRALYGPALPDLTALDEAFDSLREKYRSWAGQLAKDWNDVCRRVGPLPSDELRQRSLFMQTVLPLVGPRSKTAVFLVDALRFEMAQELVQLLGSNVTTELRARLAELPTITSVGMNVLAPVERDGRVKPVVKDGTFRGFQSGEGQVLTPADRAKWMGTRASVRQLALSLDDVRTTGEEKLRNQVAQAGLVVVHSQELDTAGESGLGAAHFESVLRDLSLAYSKLEAAGVSQFVFTADHGFLLGRRERRETFGSRGMADRRHAWSDEERKDQGYLHVSFEQLGYEGKGFLVFRDDVDEFNRGQPLSDFSHGGNSLQERVIPVLKVTRKSAHREQLRFVAKVEPLDGLMGLHRVRLRVEPKKEEGQAPLTFATTQPVEVVLRARGAAGIDVILKEVVHGEARGGAVALEPSSERWAEVLFEFAGLTDERVELEVLVTGDESSVANPGRAYTVTQRSGGLKAAPPAQPSRAEGWGERLGDASAGKAFDHLEKYGSLTELELTHLLGGPRQARAFAMRFDEHKTRLTFEVVITHTADGKRYERVGSAT
jgi:hypothetical protein